MVSSPGTEKTYSQPSAARHSTRSEAAVRVGDVFISGSLPSRASGSVHLQRRIIDLTSSPPTAEGPPPELPALAARAQRGGAAMLVLLATVAFLMVVKPPL
jgi:hypothetical protein